jgi:ribonucleotide reductase alpha subunit
MKKTDIIKIFVGVSLTLATTFSSWVSLDIYKEIDENKKAIVKNETRIESHKVGTKTEFKNIHENYVMKKDHITYHMR